jgi:hypothetical protein
VPVLERPDPGGELPEEGPVVADQEDGAGVGLQSVLQGLDGLHVQVVRGLVQGQ